MAPESMTLESKPAQAPRHFWKVVREPTWEQLALTGVLVAAALLYVWKLDQNGWANAYYSAAVQAGQHDPTAFFFGSSDWGNSITVDKPPLSLWLMGLSVRIFGLSSWSLLLPQAFITVLSTFVIFRLVHIAFPAYAALLAAGIFATTPITVLLARYNNPDPLMILLMLAALYVGIRATEKARPRLLFLAAIFLGLGFLAKQLQAFLVLPALTVTFLVFVRLPWGKRLITLAVAGGILLGASVAWPLAVDLTPAEARPFVGGSTHNSMLELTAGYNGVNRVVQHADDPMVALIPKEFTSVESDAGLFRLFNANYGQEIGWLLAAGLLSGVALSWLLIRRRLNRSQSILASAAVFWLTTTYVVLSFMGNSFHSYYTASLAPSLAICCGIGAHLLLDARKKGPTRVAVASGLVISAACSFAMWRLGTALPIEIGNGILFLGLVSAASVVVPAPWPRIDRVAGALAIAGLLIGPIACSLTTAITPQSGSNPLAGSVTANHNTLSYFLDGVKRGEPIWAKGLAIGNTPNVRLAEKLAGADVGCTWAAATYPGQTAARYQLEAGRPILPVGGFAARDPSPDLAQFQHWVASHQICYFVEQPAQLGVPGNSRELLAIQAWVKENYAPQDIDGITVYRLVS